MAEGFISLHRRIQESDLWLSEPFTRAQAWVDLLMLANYKPSEFYVRNVLVKVERGQLARSVAWCAHRWGWGEDKVRGFFKMLKTRQQIEFNNSTIISIITIINYDYYQNPDTLPDSKPDTLPDSKPDTLPDNSSQTDPTANPTHKNKVNKVNKNNNRGTRFDLIEIPLQWVKEANELRPNLNAKAIFDEFRDYWIAQPGQKGIKTDWLATWRNWIRKTNAGHPAQKAKSPDLFSKSTEKKQWGH